MDAINLGMTLFVNSTRLSTFRLCPLISFFVNSPFSFVSFFFLIIILFYFYIGEPKVFTAPALKCLYEEVKVGNVTQYANLAKMLNGLGHRTTDNRFYTKEMVKSRFNNATGDLKVKINALKQEKGALGTFLKFCKMSFFRSPPFCFISS